MAKSKLNTTKSPGKTRSPRKTSPSKAIRRSIRTPRAKLEEEPDEALSTFSETTTQLHDDTPVKQNKPNAANTQVETEEGPPISKWLISTTELAGNLAKDAFHWTSSAFTSASKLVFAALGNVLLQIGSHAIYWSIVAGFFTFALFSIGRVLLEALGLSPPEEQQEFAKIAGAKLTAYDYSGLGKSIFTTVVETSTGLSTSVAYTWGCWFIWEAYSSKLGRCIKRIDDFEKPDTSGLM